MGEVIGVLALVLLFGGFVVGVIGFVEGQNSAFLGGLIGTALGFLILEYVLRVAR